MAGRRRRGGGGSHLAVTSRHLVDCHALWQHDCVMELAEGEGDQEQRRLEDACHRRSRSAGAVEPQPREAIVAREAHSDRQREPREFPRDPTLKRHSRWSADNRVAGQGQSRLIDIEIVGADEAAQGRKAAEAGAERQPRIPPRALHPPHAAEPTLPIEHVGGRRRAEQRRGVHVTPARHSEDGEEHDEADELVELEVL